jgi:hypothetical protein
MEQACGYGGNNVKRLQAELGDAMNLHIAKQAQHS